MRIALVLTLLGCSARPLALPEKMAPTHDLAVPDLSPAPADLGVTDLAVDLGVTDLAVDLGVTDLAMTADPDLSVAPADFASLDLAQPCTLSAPTLLLPSLGRSLDLLALRATAGGVAAVLRRAHGGPGEGWDIFVAGPEPDGLPGAPILARSGVMALAAAVNDRGAAVVESATLGRITDGGYNLWRIGFDGLVQGSQSLVSCCEPAFATVVGGGEGWLVFLTDADYVYEELQSLDGDGVLRGRAGFPVAAAASNYLDPLHGEWDGTGWIVSWFDRGTGRLGAWHVDPEAGLTAVGSVALPRAPAHGPFVGAADGVSLSWSYTFDTSTGELASEIWSLQLPGGTPRLLDSFAGGTTQPHLAAAPARSVRVYRRWEDGGTTHRLLVLSRLGAIESVISPLYTTDAGAGQYSQTPLLAPLGERFILGGVNGSGAYIQIVSCDP